MEDFKPNRNSLHYKMVSADRMRYEMPEDFCSYWRSFVFRLFAAIVVILGIVLIIGAIIHTIITTPVASLIAFLIICSIIGVFYFINWVTDKIIKRKRNKKPAPKKDDGLFMTKYKSFKDQYCPMVDYS